MQLKGGIAGHVCSKVNAQQITTDGLSSMERSYARGTRYGFDRANWRGLYKVSIQEYLICAIQNIEVLIHHMKKPLKEAMARPLKDILKQKIIRGGRYILGLIRFFLYQVNHQFDSGI